MKNGPSTAGITHMIFMSVFFLLMTIPIVACAYDNFVNPEYGTGEIIFGILSSLFIVCVDLVMWFYQVPKEIREYRRAKEVYAKVEQDEQEHGRLRLILNSWVQIVNKRVNRITGDLGRRLIMDIVDMPQTRQGLIDKIDSAGKRQEFEDTLEDGMTLEQYIDRYSYEEPYIWAWILADLGMVEFEDDTEYMYTMDDRRVKIEKPLSRFETIRLIDKAGKRQEFENPPQDRTLEEYFDEYADEEPHVWYNVLYDLEIAEFIDEKLLEE